MKHEIEVAKNSKPGDSLPPKSSVRKHRDSTPQPRDKKPVAYVSRTQKGRVEPPLLPKLSKPPTTKPSTSVAKTASSPELLEISQQERNIASALDNR